MAVVYESTLEEFIKNCDNHVISRMIADKMKKTGLNFGEPEFNAWDKSLPYVAKALNHKDIDKDINVAVEYKSEITMNRFDFVLYGVDENNKESVVIIELKQWSEVRESLRPNYIYAVSHGNIPEDVFHPSYQSLRYGYILKYFYEYVQDNNTNIASCSYLHNLDKMFSFLASSKDKYPFIEKSPIFYKDDDDKLRDFVKRHVKYGRRKLLYEIDSGWIVPSKDFANMLSNALHGEPIFTLDDNQAAAVSTILYEVNHAIEHNKRATIIIRGGAGTGKSIIAVSALGQLIRPKNIEDRKNVAYCTPNYIPRKTFSELLINNDYKKSAISNLFKNQSAFWRSREFEFDCILVDEAHRAVQWKFGSGAPKGVDFIDKIFNASRVNVWFIDEDQMVTTEDYLNIEKIINYAKMYDSEVISNEELKLTTQFRCLGGSDYIRFIESFLGYTDKKVKYENKRGYGFKVFDTATEMYEAIKERQAEYKYVRLVAGITYGWFEGKKRDAAIHDVNLDNGKLQLHWNLWQRDSYVLDDNQNDRVGCIHTVQGVDLDYVGVIIGKDMIYRDGKIKFVKSAHPMDDTSGIRTADDQLAERLIRNTYKVLLTRARFGAYVHCEDKALNEYLKTFLK